MQSCQGRVAFVHDTRPSTDISSRKWLSAAEVHGLLQYVFERQIIKPGKFNAPFYRLDLSGYLLRQNCSTGEAPTTTATCLVSGNTCKMFSIAAK